MTKLRRPAPLTAALSAIALAGLLTGLGGCTPVGVAVGAGAAVGVAAYEERGVEGAARDLKLETEIAAKWFGYDHSFTAHLSATVYESRALLTGVVDSEEKRAAAVRLAWQVSGVKDVLNEIEVSGKDTVVDLARDSWITTQLTSTLTLDKEVQAINYDVKTVDGVIYLMGIAQNQKELDRVIGHAKNISHVRRVVSFVRVKGTA